MCAGQASVRGMRSACPRPRHVGVVPDVDPGFDHSRTPIVVPRCTTVPIPPLEKNVPLPISTEGGIRAPNASQMTADSGMLLLHRQHVDSLDDELHLVAHLKVHVLKRLGRED